MKTFEIVKRCPDTKARLGRLNTPHGVVETPVFAPVGTQGAVKTLLCQDLEKLGTQLILGNTYHLYLRPGMDVIQKAGGLHRFMDWKGAILTDSGGYQVFSLEKLRRISEEGVEFRSHIDGSLHSFSPEKAIEIQLALGADILMCFDECPPYPCTEDRARQALEMTTRWAKRCKETFNRIPSSYEGEGGRRPDEGTRERGKQLLYGITQGATYAPLRKDSTLQLMDLDFPGYALGGLSLGEPRSATLEMIQLSTELLPEDKPRYLMGVGTPDDLWEAVEMGIDQFDCVLPTRNGRNGQLFTSRGKLNIKNAPYREDFSPVDPDCDCDLCSRYTKAYLHHLFRAGELGALRLASLHNIAFLIRLMRKIRKSITEGTFLKEKKTFLETYQSAVSSGGESPSLFIASN
ncbi:MAG: tRNA guanosine(34) transglycosylase Tgt [Elusimicrobiota bacterium]|jgi:queuine tRNA-ribosyltransferase